MYYALTDTFAGNNPQEHTSGFANTSAPLAFRAQRERAEWLDQTRLLKARAISRREALKMADWTCGDYHGKRGWSVKVVPVYNADADAEPEFHIIASK